MLEIPEDRCERHRLFKAIDDGFKEGDVEALKMALGNSPRWFDEPMPFKLGLGHPLEYAIYWSPLGFIETLIALGSNVNYEDDAGFPALIAALSTDRHRRGDRLDVVKLLLRHGAEMTRGLNDATAAAATPFSSGRSTAWNGSRSTALSTTGAGRSTCTRRPAAASPSAPAASPRSTPQRRSCSRNSTFADRLAASHSRQAHGR